MKKRVSRNLIKHGLPTELVFLDANGLPAYLNLSMVDKQTWKVVYFSETIRISNFFLKGRDNFFMINWLYEMFGVVSVP
jgi:hypothetical protein